MYLLRHVVCQHSSCLMQTVGNSVVSLFTQTTWVATNTRRDLDIKLTWEQKTGLWSYQRGISEKGPQF